MTPAPRLAPAPRRSRRIMAFGRPRGRVSGAPAFSGSASESGPHSRRTLETRRTARSLPGASGLAWASANTTAAPKFQARGAARTRPAQAPSSPRYTGCRTRRYGPCVTSPRASGSTPKQRPRARTAINSHANDASATRSPATTTVVAASAGGSLRATSAATAAPQAANATGSRDGRLAGSRSATKMLKARTMPTLRSE